MIIPSGEKLPDNTLKKYLKIIKNLVINVFTISYSEYSWYFTWLLLINMNTLGILLSLSLGQNYYLAAVKGQIVLTGEDGKMIQNLFKPHSI